MQKVIIVIFIFSETIKSYKIMIILMTEIKFIKWFEPICYLLWQVANGLYIDITTETMHLEKNEIIIKSEVL